MLTDKTHARSNSFDISEDEARAKAGLSESERCVTNDASRRASQSYKSRFINRINLRQIASLCPSRRARKLETLGQPASFGDRPRNLRQALLYKKTGGDITEKDEKLDSRAARANQRQLNKDVAAIGAFGFGLDRLARREPQLRFDRSNIRA